MTDETTYASLAGTDDTTMTITLTAKWEDATAPVINDLVELKNYCSAVSFTVTDNDPNVVVTAGTKTLTKGEDGKYTLSAELGEGDVTVTAKDTQGNETSITVTMRNGCFGGTATCSAKAKCACCGKEHGELDPYNHSGMEHFIAVAPSEKAEGCIEHWFCSGCKKYFSDAEGKWEIDKADTVLEKLPTPDAPTGGDDKPSGGAGGNSAKAPSSASKPPIPKTGDDGMIALWLALAAASALVLGYATLRKKEN